MGPGHPSSPLSIYLLIFFPFYFSLSFIGFTYFLLLSIPSLSTRIVTLRFQAGGRRKRLNLGLVCFFINNTTTKLHCLLTEAHRCEQFAERYCVAVPGLESNPRALDCTLIRITKLQSLQLPCNKLVAVHEKKGIKELYTGPII